MNKLAVILIATLLFGCASPPKRVVEAEALPVTPQSLQQLQMALRNAPTLLQQAVSQAGSERLRSPNSADAINTTDTANSFALLIDILTHTRDAALLPDAAFEKLHKVVSGNNPPLEESYASALSGYLTQSDFACQQPVYAAYFQHRYAADTVLSTCNTQVPFSVLTQYDGAQTVWIDPKRVKSIHLLFASKSASLASRFGHVALRLVVCPEGKTASEDCDTNLIEHLVLGYRAHIDEFSLNTLKALRGDYKAYLFASRFMDVYEEYAIGEFREVYSLPLRLDDAQREQMVRALADIHWRYTGDYSFFTKNCATMMQDALRNTWPEFSSNTNLQSNYLRPDSLFEAIKSSSLAEGNKLTPLDKAEHDGYYFSSTRQFYDLALSEVKAGMRQSRFSDIESYLQISPNERRMAREKDKEFLARLNNDLHLLKAQILLEEYATLRSGRAMMIEAAKYIEEQNFLAKGNTILASLDAEHAKVFNECLLEPIRQHANPVKRLNGIPIKSELSDSPSQASTCKSMQSRQLLQEGIASIKNAKSDQWLRLNEISQYWAENIENLKLLKHAE